MGLPAKCFTCGKVWGHLWTRYVEATSGSRDPSDWRLYAEVEVDPTGMVRIDGATETPAERFFLEHRIRRICCRRMFESQPPHFPHVLEHQIPVNSRITAKPPADKV